MYICTCIYVYTRTYNFIHSLKKECQKRPDKKTRTHKMYVRAVYIYMYVYMYIYIYIYIYIIYVHTCICIFTQKYKRIYLQQQECKQNPAIHAKKHKMHVHSLYIHINHILICMGIYMYILCMYVHV